MKRDFGTGTRLSGTFATNLLFCGFAFALLLVILLGARTYHTIAARMDDNFDSRTALSYITNKVRQHDESDAVTVTTGAGGESVLALLESYGELTYETRIYFMDGAIREIFAQTGSEIDPAAGPEILPAGGLSFSKAEGGVNVRLTTRSGGVSELFLAARSGGDE